MPIEVKDLLQAPMPRVEHRSVDDFGSTLKTKPETSQLATIHSDRVIIGPMNPKVLIGAVSFILVCSVASARTPQPIAEQKCGIDTRVPAQRVFAKVDDEKPWQEYKNAKAVPELALGSGTLAEMWTGREKTVLVRTEEPGEDFDAYTEYCFNSGGQLIRLAYELRTAWGWGFRMSGPVKEGAVHDESTEFFDTKTERAMPRPQGADDVPEALKPSLFRRADQLPFYDLLSR